MVIVYNTVDSDSNKQRMLDQVTKTKMIENNCDPMFYELLELKLDFTDIEELPPFIFDIYDVDKKLVGSDELDYIGRATVYVDPSDIKVISEDIDSIDLKPIEPKWYPVRYETGAPKCGEILASFIRTEEFDHDWKLPNSEVKMMGMYDAALVKASEEYLEKIKGLPKTPKTPKGMGLPPVPPVVMFDEFRVELNVLGLRGLISPGLLPVKKAYIEFMTHSLVPPLAASALSSIQTQTGPTGPNPTLNEVISFSVPLPIEHLYAPSMACRVFDKVFKGFSGQLIGTFTIPIGEIMVAQREDYDKNCQMLDKLIKDLEDVIEGKVVLDYEPVNKNVDSNLVEDKKFREDQRKEKEKYSKIMEEKKEVKKPISERMLDKIAPEPAKPTAVLEK